MAGLYNGVGNVVVTSSLGLRDELSCVFQSSEPCTRHDSRNDISSVATRDAYARAAFAAAGLDPQAPVDLSDKEVIAMARVAAQRVHTGWEFHKVAHHGNSRPSAGTVVSGINEFLLDGHRLTAKDGDVRQGRAIILADGTWGHYVGRDRQGRPVATSHGWNGEDPRGGFYVAEEEVSWGWVPKDAAERAFDDDEVQRVEKVGFNTIHRLTGTDGKELGSEGFWAEVHAQMRRESHQIALDKKFPVVTVYEAEENSGPTGLATRIGTLLPERPYSAFELTPTQGGPAVVLDATATGDFPVGTHVYLPDGGFAEFVGRDQHGQAYVAKVTTTSTAERAVYPVRDEVVSWWNDVPEWELTVGQRSIVEAATVRAIQRGVDAGQSIASPAFREAVRVEQERTRLAIALGETRPELTQAEIWAQVDERRPGLAGTGDSSFQAAPVPASLMLLDALTAPGERARTAPQEPVFLEADPLQIIRH